MAWTFIGWTVVVTHNKPPRRDEYHCTGDFGTGRGQCRQWNA
jgi:hypothetical protein